MVLDFSSLVIDEISPIYMQLIRFVKVSIVRGEVHSGDEMPSRRLLSATLGINPSTIQKAYKQLELEGLLISYAGSKSILKVSEPMIKVLREELIQNDALQLVHNLKNLGLTKEQAWDLIMTLWEH